MELLVILSSLCICLSLLVNSCAASTSQEIFVLHEQSNKELVPSREIMFPRTALPRKLRILQEPVKDSEVQGSSITYNDQTKQDASGEPHKRQQNVVATGRGTWKDWVERADKSEYFTMDYGPVQKRRHVHNKSLPAHP